MHRKRYGTIPTDDTITILVDLTDIGNINRKRLQELSKINADLSIGNPLAVDEGVILERMVEIVIYNLRRNRDRLSNPDAGAEDSMFRKHMENEKMMDGQYSAHAQLVYAVVEAKIRTALKGYWDRLYEPLEQTTIFPKAISNDAVLIIITSFSQSERVFRHLTGLSRLIKGSPR